jgi:hypothetical protein
MLQSSIASRLVSFSIVSAYDDPAAEFQFAYDDISAGLHPGLSSSYPCLQHLTIGCSYLEGFSTRSGTRKLCMSASNQIPRLQSLTFIVNTNFIDSERSGDMYYLKNNQMLQALAATVPQQLIIASHKLKYCCEDDIPDLLYPFTYHRKTPINFSRCET